MAKINRRSGLILFSKKQGVPLVLLVFSNYSNKWEFPRGGIEPNENEKQAAIRELEEEGGIKINNAKLYKVYEYEEWHATHKSKVKLHFDVVMYTAFIDSPIRPNPIDTKEIQVAKWVPIHQAIKLLYKSKQNEYIKALLKAYLIQIRLGNL